MLIPVILSGGAGTRLWPASRQAYPKPFMRLGDGHSLLYRTLDRALACIDGDEIVTVTAQDHYFLTRDETYRQNVNATVSAFGQEVMRQAANVPTLLNATEFVVVAAQIVIIGDERSPDTQSLVRAVLERSVPCRMMTILKPGQKLPNGHPAFGKGQVNGKATAYACVGTTCSDPINDPVQLSNMLLPRPFQIQAQMQAQQQAALRNVAANNR